MNGGSGSESWEPKTDSTGICKASAGNIIGGTYQKATSDWELTPEKVIYSTFPSADSETLKVYFCDQFFKDDTTHGRGGESYAPTLAQYVDSAMRESWQRQVNTWDLGTPPDADNVHRVFVSDTVNWYHAPPVGRDSTGPAVSYPGANRQIAITHNPWTWNNNYTNDDSLVRSYIAHEFHHGIQYGWSSAKWSSSSWDWFTEAQARFVQSAQCECEEFRDTFHDYPRDANKYLTQHLNTSLESLSIDAVLKGYPYGLFWRCMFERFDSTGIADGVQFVRDCYAANVGTGNSIGRGEAAIDAGRKKWSKEHNGYVPSGYEDFSQMLDQFAVACYLNDTSFRLWHDPHGVYSRPHLTFGSDTSFRVGPSETDSIRVINSIPHSFGIDLIPVALNYSVDTVLVSLTRPANRALSARLVRVYRPGSIIRYDVEPPITSLPDSSTTWCQCTLATANKERICLAITRQDTSDTSGCVDTARFWVKRSVGVSEMEPENDTVVAGKVITPRVVVKNHGWMSDEFPVWFSIRDVPVGTLVYSHDTTVTLKAGADSIIVFPPDTTTEGSFALCCSVAIASDTVHGDDVRQGTLVALRNVWQVRPSILDSVHTGAALAAVGDTAIYAFRGGTFGNFYRYDVKIRDWDELTSTPFGTDYGSSLVWDGGDYLYALSGCNLLLHGHHSELWRYDIERDTWGILDYSPYPLGPGSEMVWGGKGSLFIIAGGYTTADSNRTFLRYQTLSSKWSFLSPVMATCGLGTSMCWDGDSLGRIYTLCCVWHDNVHADTFCAFDLNAYHWDLLCPCLYSGGYEAAALVYDSLGRAVYADFDMEESVEGRFYRYDVARRYMV
jgi:hypothetical protein